MRKASNDLRSAFLLSDAAIMNLNRPQEKINHLSAEGAGTSAAVPQRERTGRHAFFVAAGILVSRLVGLVRQRIFGHYFGLSDAADAFAAAFRVPNFLQNLFGEGVLSASFHSGVRAFARGG